MEAAPIAAPDRIAILDVLRGIALFGVMAINVVQVFRVSIFKQFLPDPVGGTGFDYAVHAVLMIGFDFKALALFSMLFGVGLAIQFERLSEHPRRGLLLVRRLCALLVIGVIHLVLVWNGDILAEYSIAGVVALMFLYGPRQRCAVAGIGLLALYVIVTSLAALPSKAWMLETVAEANRIYATGTFAEVMAFRIRELPGLLPLHINVFPRTVGLMLIGAALWRTHVFRPKATANRALPWVAGIAVPLGIFMSLLHASGAMRGSWQALLSFERLAIMLMAVGYGAAIAWLVGQSRWRTWLMWAEPLGRMAFTNYLTQSLIFGFIFYGYGLGLFGQLGVTAALAIGTAVYALQALLSSYWLRRFRFGPMEWLWRSAMYWRWQPFRQ